MATSYSIALVEIELAARKVKESRPNPTEYESVTLERAVGRVAARDHFSPISTPEFDTSAMDGYAIRSESTQLASPDYPVFFRVHGTTAAGDGPHIFSKDEHETDWEGGPEPCIEIMTGGRFPEDVAGRTMDACVKVEDVVAITAKVPRLETCIAVAKPVTKYANRHFAGEDIREGDIVLKAGQTLRSAHLMPLASVGLELLSVQVKPRVSIWSTGNELTSHASRVRDVNGVYLTTASQEFGADPAFLGVIRDDADAIVHAIQEQIRTSPPDVMITSGGVSVGQFDHVRKALEIVGATIIFHGLSIRPGHPVLFALLPSSNGKVAFFGLPGNPGAAAACFRFLTVPYLRHLLEQEREQPVIARLASSEPGGTPRWNLKDLPSRGLSQDRFRSGVLRMTEGGPVAYEASKQHGPAKLAPFVEANCWIHVKARDTAEMGQLVPCYPISPGLPS